MGRPLHGSKRLWLPASSLFNRQTCARAAGCICAAGPWVRVLGLGGPVARRFGLRDGGRGALREGLESTVKGSCTEQSKATVIGSKPCFAPRRAAARPSRSYKARRGAPRRGRARPGFHTAARPSRAAAAAKTAALEPATMAAAGARGSAEARSGAEHLATSGSGRLRSRALRCAARRGLSRSYAAAARPRRHVGASGLVGTAARKRVRASHGGRFVGGARMCSEQIPGGVPRRGRAPRRAFGRRRVTAGRRPTRAAPAPAAAAAGGSVAAAGSRRRRSRWTAPCSRRRPRAAAARGTRGTARLGWGGLGCWVRFGLVGVGCVGLGWRRGFQGYDGAGRAQFQNEHATRGAPGRSAWQAARGGARQAPRRVWGFAGPA
jgi:hypothetical protein